MDELDILLDELPSVKAPQEAPEDDMVVALEEFQSATNPKDRLEALKLLIHLSK